MSALKRNDSISFTSSSSLEQRQVCKDRVAEENWNRCYPQTPPSNRLSPKPFFSPRPSSTITHRVNFHKKYLSKIFPVLSSHLSLIDTHQSRLFMISTRWLDKTKHVFLSWIKSSPNHVFFSRIKSSPRVFIPQLFSIEKDSKLQAFHPQDFSPKTH